MNLFDSLSISGSALLAERERSEIIATNMANAETTHTEAGGPYHRREVIFETPGSTTFRLALSLSTQFKLHVSQVIDDPSPPIMRYQPGHPDANKDGYVAYPPVNPAAEMVDLMGSVRAYQLNASAIAAAKQMIQSTIDILKS
jgi:flagellar basal-body rod protein FlgC